MRNLEMSKLGTYIYGSFFHKIFQMIFSFTSLHPHVAILGFTGTAKRLLPGHLISSPLFQNNYLFKILLAVTTPLEE